MGAEVAKGDADEAEVVECVSENAEREVSQSSKCNLARKAVFHSVGART